MDTATRTPDMLPRWDLDTIYPGPESPELRAAFAKAAGDIAALESLFDRHGVGTAGPGAVDAALVAAFGEITNRYNALLEDAMRINGYLYCLTMTDVRDEDAKRAAGEWRQIKSGLSRLAPRYTAWVGGLDLDALAARSELAREHEPALRRIKTAAGHLMDPGQEALAAALYPSASGAWMTLRDEVSGSATARIVLDGEERELPLSELENLLFHADREVRRRAFEVDRETIRTLETPLAACINGAKGQQATLSAFRGWADPLDQALFANAIDRPILDAMLAAIDEALPDYRRYLRAKARLLGLPVLAGYDILAPVGEPQPWPFAAARDLVIARFTAAHPRMGALAERAFAEQWIDAAPRLGKDAGAFSVPTGGDTSRVFLNYVPAYDWMSALAHELGHSYHAMVVPQAGRTALQAPPNDTPAPLAFPLTLVETASTFCEVLVQRGARDGAAPAQEAALLDGWLMAFTGNVFNSLSNFLFERELFALRPQREVSAAELDALMAEARRQVTADAVAPETVWSTSWVAPHFTYDGFYYNFPYAFGMLFSVGLLAARDAEPDGFFDRFDTLLADSGMREAQDLAAPFGIDLRDPAFWRSGLDVFRADVDRFEELAGELAP
jgi:oligoendopeptidase F